MQLKDAIRFYRKRAGITQQDLADKLNINRSTVARYENGSNNPSPLMIDKISEVVGVDLLEKIDLFKGEDWETTDSSSPYELAMESFIEYIATEYYYNLAVIEDSTILNMDEPDGESLFIDCSAFMKDPFIVAPIRVSGNEKNVVRIPNKELIDFWNYVVMHASMDFKNLLEKYNNGEQD